MPLLPLALVEWIFLLPSMRRPEFLADVSEGRPGAGALRRNVVVLEIRDGHLKWAHLTCPKCGDHTCPKCGDHVELPMAGRQKWTVTLDWLRRPTFAPSIWEKGTCGAHFHIRRGKLHWSK